MSEWSGCDEAWAGSPYVVGVYASTDSRFDDKSILVGRVRVKQPLNDGTSVKLHVSIDIPASIGAKSFSLFAVVTAGVWPGRNVVGSVENV